MYSGGLQYIVTNNKYVFLINIINGLPYFKICLFANNEWDILPKVMMTSDSYWDHKVIGNIVSNKKDGMTQYLISNMVQLIPH